MAKRIEINGTTGIKSYQADGTTVWTDRSISTLNSKSDTHFPSTTAMEIAQLTFKNTPTEKMRAVDRTGNQILALEDPTTTDGTAITLISNAVVTAGYEDAFSSVETGTTSLPPSSSENRTWAFRYTCKFEGTCRIRGNGAPTGAMISGNDRAIYILVNGTQVASAGSSVNSSNWAEKTNQTIAVGDLVQYDIRDVYWRYSAGGVAAQNCEIRVGTYS